ncbi:hypothetical protein HELRODRAFT_91727, partial [Helobdella robusta]|uniref:Cadherin domain-containing protein n=1 Tax=Helobdella robusta TaxID=6412 RepID=T1G881_HELRO
TTVYINLLDVNDNDPAFERDRYYTFVWEGVPIGTFVTQITATDADSGKNSRLLYDITSGNPDGAFIIDPPSTGIVKTRRGIDRESRDVYRLVISARDSADIPRSASVILKVHVFDANDNAPEFVGLDDVVVVKEGCSPIGSEVFTVRAADRDGG